MAGKRFQVNAISKLLLLAGFAAISVGAIGNFVPASGNDALDSILHSLAPTLIVGGTVMLVLAMVLSLVDTDA